MEADRLARFEMVRAGQQFLFRALPLRDPASRNALEVFRKTVTASSLTRPEVDAVLLRCLKVVDDRAGHRLPSLIDRYLSERSDLTEPCDRFVKCIEDLLRYRGIGNALVQRAIAHIEGAHDDQALSQRAVAMALKVRPAALSIAFKSQTGHAFCEYLRIVRLNCASTLLIMTDRSIKEVWSSVGYKHPSNFDHDFRRQFGCTPREYRARGIRLEIPLEHRWNYESDHPPHATGTVLVVDDDRGVRDIIGRSLLLIGYRLAVASTVRQALTQAAEVSPHVILLDYRLPDGDGLAVLRAIRQWTGARQPAVAIFTADWGVYDCAAEVEALKATIVSKLCDIDEVQRLVASLMPYHLLKS